MRSVDATPDLVPAFLARLGADRAARIEAVPGNGPGWLERSIAASGLTWCGLDDAGPVNMGGVLAEGGPAPGYVWQVITPDVARHKRAYITQARDMMRRALLGHARIWTVIEASYRAALRHARRTGFVVGAPVRINGVLACHCERLSHHV